MPHRAPRMAAREERRKYGQSLRQKVGRVSHADWAPKHRKVSILKLLRASERGRLANLLPIKAARMAASPFGFYRGAVPIMASDLSMLPSSGIYAQLCGDAHVQNLGAFEGPDGRLIFNIDDFDETIRGPWEWDVKRMAVSLVLVGREDQQHREGMQNRRPDLCRKLSRGNAPILQNAHGGLGPARGFPPPARFTSAAECSAKS